MAFAIFKKARSFHLCRVFSTINETGLPGKLSKFHTFIGNEESRRVRPWLSSTSSNLLMWNTNTRYESLCSEATHTTEERRRLLSRILYRSRQRGFLELDLILGKWAEENIEKLDDTKLKALVEVLNLENPELWKWLSGQEAMPEHLTENPVFMEIHEHILGALKTHSASETRAKLGQPWVRGWDDNRKIGGPQAGNQ